MALFTDLPAIITRFPAKARWQDKAVLLLKTTRAEGQDPNDFTIDASEIGASRPTTYVLRPDDLSAAVIVYDNKEIPLADFDWSWKGRFKRMRTYMGHDYSLIAELTGNKAVSIHRVVSSKDFPRSLRYAVHIWEQMYAQCLERNPA
jgi:hypothetical protein